MTLTVGSLFAGIGGIDLGLERAGMKTVWQVEIDPWAQRVLAKHWPDVERFADVKEVGAHNLQPVDVIAGGFPCQDLSYAGKGAGIKAGTRSGLWFEYARIIRELRPRYVFVENVPALLARGLGIVLGDLAALGYDAEWDCVPASAIGASHRRDRVWIVAYAADDGWERDGGSRDGGPGSEDRRFDVAHSHGWRCEVGCEQDCGSFGPAVQASRRSDADRRGASLADANGQRPQGFWTEHQLRAGRGQSSFGRSDWWRLEPSVGRVADGVPGRVDRLKGLGNSVVPQVVEAIGRRIVAWEEANAND